MPGKPYQSYFKTFWKGLPLPWFYLAQPAGYAWPASSFCPKPPPASAIYIFPSSSQVRLVGKSSPSTTFSIVLYILAEVRSSGIDFHLYLLSPPIFSPIDYSLQARVNNTKRLERCISIFLMLDAFFFCWNVFIEFKFSYGIVRKNAGKYQVVGAL